VSGSAGRPGPALWSPPRLPPVSLPPQIEERRAIQAALADRLAAAERVPEAPSESPSPPAFTKPKSGAPGLGSSGLLGNLPRASVIQAGAPPTVRSTVSAAPATPADPVPAAADPLAAAQASARAAAAAAAAKAEAARLAADRERAELAARAAAALSETNGYDVPGWDSHLRRASPDDVMSLVFVASEAAPFAKTGGLGDVMQSLPKAMAARGHRVVAVMPLYRRDWPGVEDSGARLEFNTGRHGTQTVGLHRCLRDGVDWLFVDHWCFQGLEHDIYAGDRESQQFRFALLAKAALEIPKRAPLLSSPDGHAPLGEDSLVFVANDWHAALLPFYLQAHYRDHGQYEFARSTLVLHNMSFQGRGPMSDLDHLEVPDHLREKFLLDDPVGGEHANVLMAGLTYAHRVMAVSAGYAWEVRTPEGGWGLHEVMQRLEGKTEGIVNGIDLREWSPEIDAEHLGGDGYRIYGRTDVREGKAACKAALQREFGLPEDPNIPLLGFIGRLDYQKGVDLLRDNYGGIMDTGAQLVLLGSGNADLENDLRSMEGWKPDQCRSYVGFSVKLAHRITAGCDFLLMPSRFEPCGLNQLYAMRYGTVPIVHAVGGLRDTVHDFNPESDTGTGWTFPSCSGGDFLHALGNALYTYREHRETFDRIVQRGMEQDLSWGVAAEQYEQALLRAKNTW